MAILSLGRFINAKSDLDGAFRRMVFLLTEALALQAVESDPAEREHFQTTIRKLERDLQDTTDPENVLVTTGEIINTLTSYHRSVERVRRSQVSELHSIITMLANKLMAMADSSDLSCRKLSDVEKNLRGASQVDDLRVLRVRLEDALVGIQQEAGRQAGQFQDLKSQVEALHKPGSGATSAVVPAGGGFDQVTGLPSRAAACAKLGAALRGEVPHTFAAVFSIQRLATINLRFGFAAGDNLLMLYAQHIAQRLGSDDEMFRWRGPTLVALLSRSRSHAAVSMEMRRICAARFDHNLTVDQKAVLIPISAAFLVTELKSHGEVSEVANILDRFALSQCPDDDGKEV